MIEPEFMCSQHRVGEHGEIHKHKHNFVKKHSINGRIKPVVQIEPSSMKKRHDELAETFKNHNSPYTLPDLSYLSKEKRGAKVDLLISIKELSNRCPKCAELLKNHPLVKQS